MGFFAVPYTIIIYPILYIIFPRLWAIRERSHVTSRLCATGSAAACWRSPSLTGIVATMPTSRSMVGMEVVIGASVFRRADSAPSAADHRLHHLAAFTYTAGLRAAPSSGHADLHHGVGLVISPGGYGAIFASVPQEKLLLPSPSGDSFGAYSAYATLALGSAFALFLYPHAMTGILSSSSGNVIRRNAAFLAAYSFILGLIALLGYMAIAAGVKESGIPAGFAQ
jgi:SSS family solute:Na+ symporter